LSDSPLRTIVQLMRDELVRCPWKSRAERPRWATRLGQPVSGELREVPMSQHSSGVTTRLVFKSALLPCLDVAHSGISYPATLLIREYARKHGRHDCLTTHSLLFFKPPFLLTSQGPTSQPPKSVGDNRCQSLLG
jgi:hypothetical protein